MKTVRVLGGSLKYWRDFPAEAKHDVRNQRDTMQHGARPDDFNPTRSASSFTRPYPRD